MEERIKGFQRALAKKDDELKTLRESQGEAAALKKRIEELEYAQMPEYERNTFLSRREQAEVQKLRTDLELAKLALKYPNVADHFNAIYNAQTAEEQAQYLQGLLNGASRGTSTPVDDDDLSGIDMNNPMRSVDDQLSISPNIVNNEATADRILKAFGVQPAATAYRD
jgi:hypothetical protein